MTNPDELHRTFAARPRRLWILVLLALGLLGVLAMPLARPGWRALKNWRADYFAREAKDFLAENQSGLAFERARSALQLVPDRPDLLRLNATLLSGLGSEISLGLWQRLLASGQDTLEDRLSFVETALGFDRPDLARDVIGSLETDPNAPAADRRDRLTALFLIRTGEPARALDFARRAHQIAPFNPTNGLLLATLLSAGTNPPGLDEARQLFRSLSRTNGPLRLEALRGWAEPRIGDRTDREAVVELLSGLPERTFAEETLLAETRMLLEPHSAATLASNLLARLPRDDWDLAALAANALLRRGRYAEVLSLTGAGRGQMNRTLFLARYEALVGNGQGDEAYRHLLTPNAPLALYELELIRARAAQETGDLKRRDGHLKDLLRAAGDNPVRIQRVAELAEAGQTRAALEVATEAWTRLTQIPDSAANAFRHLQRLADQRGDTWTARDYARRAVRLDPRIPALGLEIAYYDLLLGDDLDRALVEAERQVAEQPADLFARAVNALAHLRLGSPERARALLDRAVLSPESMRPEILAVIAAAYGANGLEGRARELARSLPLSRLRPEEKELIRPWLLPEPLGAPSAAPAP